MIPYGRHSTSFLDALRVFNQVKFKSLTQGKSINELEESVAEYVGAKYAVAVSSATAGLHLSLLALNLKENSKVISSPISFVASSNTALYCNLTPYFVDVDLKTGNIKPENILKAVKNNYDISAIIPVHLSGHPCDMREISSIAKQYKLKVVEDAAHALGSKYQDGSKVGNCKFSDLTVFSLHPVKTITAGEGGIITTNDSSLYNILRELRTHGINQSEIVSTNQFISHTNHQPNLWFQDMVRLGFHYRMTEIQAVLGISQLKRIKKFLNKRKEIALTYLKFFESNPIYTAELNKDQILRSSNHLFKIKVNFSNFDFSKNELISFLRKSNIITQVHYKPIPLNSYYKNLGFETNFLPNTMAYYELTLSLPIYFKLRKRQIKKIYDRLETFRTLVNK